MELLQHTSHLSLAFIILLNLIVSSQALHFYLDGASSAPKCFYEELPKDTMVVGTHKRLPFPEHSSCFHAIGYARSLFPKAITQPSSTPLKPHNTKPIPPSPSPSRLTRPSTTTTASSTPAVPPLANSHSLRPMLAITAYALPRQVTIQGDG